MSSALSTNSDMPIAESRLAAPVVKAPVVRSTVTPLLHREWVDLASANALNDLGSSVIGHVGATTVLVVRSSVGLVAVADHCTHCRAALHNGVIDGDSVICPARRCVFHLLDGAVLSGPATRSLPMFELQTVRGRIQVRRAT